MKEAAAAIDEITALDRNVPELRELRASLDELRRSASTSRRGPWLAAVAVFVAALIGGSWLPSANEIRDLGTETQANSEASPTADPASQRIPNPESLRVPNPQSQIPTDEHLVKLALQRYRAAGDGPHACDVKLRGEAATATCRGRARGVSAIGGRERRAEPRTWSFTLHKAGTDWKVDSARAEQ